MTIIINNVYAFQYPTKNRCTILVQPSFAKLVLLPIREAYEWKPKGGGMIISAKLCLLPIREAYEWKHLGGPKGRLRTPLSLLPIREAYEWKLRIVLHQQQSLLKPCFQFVKRMNGNR